MTIADYTATYSGQLTINSARFSRNGTSESDYYYQAIRIRVMATGDYTFTSSSTIDTYGYLYQANFYPSYPEYNLLTEDDDGSGSRDFQITVTVRSDLTYILVFKTFDANENGPFTITGSGEVLFCSVKRIKTCECYLNRLDF